MQLIIVSSKLFDQFFYWGNYHEMAFVTRELRISSMLWSKKAVNHETRTMTDWCLVLVVLQSTLRKVGEGNQTWLWVFVIDFEHGGGNLWIFNYIFCGRYVRFGSKICSNGVLRAMTVSISGWKASLQIWQCEKILEDTDMQLLEGCVVAWEMERFAEGLLIVVDHSSFVFNSYYSKWETKDLTFN